MIINHSYQLRLIVKGVALLYKVAVDIFNDESPNKEIEVVLPRNNNTALTFEYKHGQDNQMEAHLTIERDGRIIPFKFLADTFTVKENGQKVTKVIQSCLGAFAMTLEGYLLGIGIDRQLSKLSDEYETAQDDNEKKAYTAKSNGQGNNYQGGNNGSYQGGNNGWYRSNNNQGYGNQGNNGGYRYGNYGGYKKPYNSYNNGKGSYGNNGNYQNNPSS